MPKPVVLIVLDGWGHREDLRDNAIGQAETPFFDSLLVEYPHTLLNASEEYVGLPAGQMGNSEIGHMTIGSGTIIDTDLVKIAKAIRNDEFVTNPAFVKLFEHVKKHHSVLHVMGLLSSGGVHSHEDHLHAFLAAAKRAGIERLAVHAFTDGRDTSPQSSVENLKRLEATLEELGIGHIASVSGRFYAMDRDKNHDRQAKAEAVIFDDIEHDSSPILDKKPSDVVAQMHADGGLDEHIVPMAFAASDGSMNRIGRHDGIFFFNFRADRARQLAASIAARKAREDFYFVTMTEYDDSDAADVAYPKSKIETTLAAEISKAGLTQAHIAESEKYAHATFFLNGGRNEPHENESHILIESRKDVATHDLAPKMRAEGIVDAAIAEIEKGTDFIFINFANADMVGHTANVPAIVEAVQEVDAQLQRVVTAAAGAEGAVFITADHGNAELNRDPESGERHTAHTVNVVPAILTMHGIQLRHGGTLADIAPTILELLEVPKPSPMTGASLILPA